MAKTYEQKMKNHRSLCINHAQMQTLYVKFEIESGRPESAAAAARVAAQWAFEAYPELREGC
jgi:hypothetical protein